MCLAELLREAAKLLSQSIHVKAGGAVSLGLDICMPNGAAQGVSHDDQRATNTN